MEESFENNRTIENRGLQFPWLIKMAWRDSRRNRSRLFLFVSSVILGIAALVAIYSLSNNLRQEIDKQAASLIGADLEITSNKPVSPALKGLIDSLGDRRSEERRFASMVYFPKGGGTRLIQVRALQGEFPYYGDLETNPMMVARTFRNEQQALVDQTLMMQFNATAGDSIKVGNVTFRIAGILISAPGQTGFSASVAPVVYIPLKFLKQTGLEQKGSNIGYRFYYKYDQPINVRQLTAGIEPRLEKEGLNYDTVESQKEDTARSFSDVTRFLSLLAHFYCGGCFNGANALFKLRKLANNCSCLCFRYNRGIVLCKTGSCNLLFIG
jgi:putative ABC transport system permease protein